MSTSVDPKCAAVEIERLNALSEEELDKELEKLGVNFEDSKSKLLEFAKKALKNKDNNH
ncbi:MAG: hypothetical protein QM500_18195 [Methylococcales bacterium]